MWLWNEKREWGVGKGGEKGMERGEGEWIEEENREWEMEPKRLGKGGNIIRITSLRSFALFIK